MIGRILLLLLLVAASSARAQAPDTTRLSPSVIPQFERIDLTVDPRLEIYRGSVAIDLSTIVPTDSIRMHGEGFDISSLSIDGNLQPSGSGAAFREHGYLVVRSQAVLPPGRHSVVLKFLGKYRRGAEGISKFLRDSLAYVCTQMESNFARRAFPCFDEPHFKILYQMSIKVPEEMFAASNMPVRSEVRSDGFRTVLFDTTRPTSSYLLALVVGPYDTMSVPGTSVPVRLIGPRGFLARTPLLARYLPVIMRSLEEYAGSPFPFPKLDLAFVSGFSGLAMENSGLIILTDTYGLPDSPDNSVFQRRETILTVAHEMTHMWLGDLVTVDWWDDIWLNEGLTEWMSSMVVDERFPDLAMQEGLRKRYFWSKETDLVSTIQAVKRSFSGHENTIDSWANGEGGALTYLKPTMILRMVDHWCGRPVVREIVRSYLRSHRWGTVSTDDFLHSTRLAAGSDIESVIHDYILQPGIPVVAFERRGADSVELHQYRYQGLDRKEKGESIWHIPLTIRYSKGGNSFTKRFLFARSDTVIRLAGSGQLTLLVPNVSRRGYYLSLLPIDLSVAVLASGECSRDEREDAMDNLMTFSKAGLISPVEILSLAEKVHPSSDSTLAPPWLSLLTQIKGTYSRGPQDSTFDLFFESQALPVLQRMGYAPLPGENGTDRETRSNAQDLLAHRKDVQRRWDNIGRQLLSDTTRELTYEISRYLICLAVDEGTDSLWNVEWSRFSRSHDDLERGVLVGMMAYHQGESARARNLGVLLGPELQPGERLAMLVRLDRAFSARGDTIGHRRHMEWVRDHDAELRSILPPDEYESIVLPALVWGLADVPFFERLFAPGRFSRGFQDSYKANLSYAHGVQIMQSRYRAVLQKYMAEWDSRAEGK
jgi:alanyl aminopeptidase